MADEPNEIDYLMNLDPLSLHKTENGIEAIVAYYRSRRALSESGIKPKKETGPKISLAELGIFKKPEGVKRRI